MKPRYYHILFFIFILNITSVQLSFSHYKARYHVIIDTDGGLDDFRAICMLLANPDIEVIAITTADGVLSPDDTYDRVTSLMNRFGHEGIPVAPGMKMLKKPPAFRAYAEKLNWVGETEVNTKEEKSGAELIKEALELEEQPVEIIALGPLTNIAEALKENPDLIDEIRQILWYNEGKSKKGVNYTLDPEAALWLINSPVSIKFISGEDICLNSLEKFTLSLDTVPSEYAHSVRDFYKNNNLAVSQHFMSRCLADDLIPLYMAFPGDFIKRVIDEDTLRMDIQPLKEVDFQDKILALLNSDKEDRSIIFNSFPNDPGLFEADVAPLAEEIIQRHGLKEWKLVVLTNEFHEHLGIYSIIGAKMGLRAREYFRVGIDELKITSYAGSNPPVSCLNDGLQASTGATLGHGTIRVDDSDPQPAAVFTFKNTVIKITLKEDIVEKIQNDVRRGVQEYGLNTDGYWQYIRELAIKYWLEMDRREIFRIEECQDAPISHVSSKSIPTASRDMEKSK